jgi:hypothetical protein
MQSDQVLKTSQRADTTAFTQGTPSAVAVHAAYAPRNYEESHRNQSEGYQPGPSNASYALSDGAHSHRDAQLQSHTNYVNNRSMNAQPRSFIGGVSGAIGAVVAPLTETIRQTIRSEIDCNPRLFGNAAGGAGGTAGGGYVIAAHDAPKATIKETTLYQPASYVGNQADNAGYMISQPYAPATQRDSANHGHFILGAGTKYGHTSRAAYENATTDDTREKSTVGYQPQGGQNVWNPHIAIAAPSKNENDFINVRQAAPGMLHGAGPSASTYGAARMPAETNHAEHNYDRLDGRLLTALVNNPYSHNHVTIMS